MMELKLNLKKELEEELAPVKEDFLGALQSATEAVLTKVLPLPVGIPEELPDPDWDSTEAIQDYINALRSQGDIIGHDLTHSKSNLPAVEKVNEVVRDLLQQAVVAINKKRMEIQANVRDIEAVARANNERTQRANRRLAELWEQKANLERLAALEGTVKELCENFDSWHKARH